MPADLVNVIMGNASDHAGWVYHGLLVGPVSSAAILLDRVMVQNSWRRRVRPRNCGLPTKGLLCIRISRSVSCRDGG